jgi:inorganic phosphate transporter, PiT family
MTLGTAVLVVAILVGLYMAWTIGANDVANAMGTSVGSGALTLGGAIVLAGVLEFAGAVTLGSTVTRTISRGIVETERFEPTGTLGPQGPLVLALGMLSALLAAAIWLHVATHFRLPVSTTHSIVGAVAGIGIATFGLDGVNWGAMSQIAASWVVSPFLGGLLAFLSFMGIRRWILQSTDPVAATRASSPYIVGVVVTVMVLSFIYKALRTRIEAPPLLLAIAVAVGAGVVAAVMTAALVRMTAPREGASSFAYVERIFAFLQIGTACFVAFAHGANDVANAVGPVAAVVSLANDGFAVVATTVIVPFWVLVLGGAGIVLGLATYGYRVIATIGKGITEVTPTRGFSAEFGAATTVLVASSLGIPISTTHTLVGGVIGVGFAQGIAALNLRVIRNIVGSWLATVPIAALIAMALLTVARAIVL